MKNPSFFVGVACLVAQLANAGQVMVTEIMFHPGLGEPGGEGYIAEDTRQEYIELYNSGPDAVDLQGWRLSKAVDYAFPAVVIPPQGYLVVAADADLARFKAAYQVNYPAITNAAIVGGWSGRLRNSGDSIELKDSLGAKIDSVSYATEGDWAMRREGEGYPGQPTWWRGWGWQNEADAGGKSLELINAAVPNKHAQNWAASRVDGGTPGGPNSVVATTTAPIILKVTHAPTVPRSTEAVTITAHLADSTATNAAVLLCHRLDGDTNFQQTAMLDDGQHRDGPAGDGVYGAILPPQTNQALTEFYVQATGADGLVRTWPGPTDSAGTQGANALYQVDDTDYAGSQPLYRILVSRAEWKAWLHLMDNVSGGRYSDPAMNGTWISADGLGTEIRYAVSVRNRGAGTREAKPHNFHVGFPNDRPWRGLTSLALNTRTVHAQVAGNAINVAAGLPCPYGMPVQVRVNGANLAHAQPDGSTDSFQFGSYFAFQPYGKEWLDTHLPSDSNANIYKGVWNFDNHSLKHPADFAYLGEDAVAYRKLYSTNGPTDSTGPYTKQSNVSEDDWTDLIHLCKTLSQTPDTNFYDAVSATVDIEEWLKYFAVTSLVGNGETTLGTGAGDDYALYCGQIDPRFRILPHDMDTILGQGDNVPSLDRSVFKACDVPAINRFLKNPQIAPRYFAMLQAQADTTFSAGQMDPLLDQVLGAWVDASYIQKMKDFVAARRVRVLAQIPRTLSVTTGLEAASGYPQTTNSSVALSGNADAIQTRSVLVNGVAAAWTAWQAAWSAPKVALQPGLNFVLVQAFDENQLEIDRTNVVVWRDTSTTTSIAGGTLNADAHWTPANGPYLIQANLTVASGVTLTIDPGTVVYLASGVDLIVANGGRILAEGTPSEGIVFASPPNATTSWGGLVIKGASGSVETRLAYVYFVGNNTTCIEVAGGTLYLDHANFGTTTHQYVALDGASFLISHCYFPSATTTFELLHGTGGIKAGGRGIVRDSFFGRAIGYNDVMDFTGGNRPNQPIIQYYNNVFIGSDDDILDLDGTDAWIEGSIFLHVHRNIAPDSSSAISGGDNGSDTSEVTIVGNIIYDCDNAATAKQGDYFTLFNNTIVRMTKNGGVDFDSGVVNVRDTTPEITDFARGFYLQDNVIADVENNRLARNYDASQTTVIYSNNIMPVAWDGPGGGNIVAAPRLKHIPDLAETQFKTWQQAQVMWQWFANDWPTNEAGRSVTPKGCPAHSGVVLTGVPLGTTAEEAGSIMVGPWAGGTNTPAGGFPLGSGFTHYRWQLDGGDWSTETAITNPIVLTGLANGTHHLAVIGKNDALLYQNDAALGEHAMVTQTADWVVDKSLATHVRLNEILAHNVSVPLAGGVVADAIELFNGGTTAADLSGMSLAKGTNDNAFVFPAGTALEAGACLVVYADAVTNVAAHHLGYGLESSGGSVYLFNRDGSVADSVDYGLQLPNLSIGRRGDGSWTLNQPTLGAANIEEPLAGADSLVINEWLAAARTVAASDFIELYNPAAEPAALGGLILANQSVCQPGLPAIAPLSYIAGHGFTVFYADGQAAKGARHLDFTLPLGPSAIGLFDADFSPIDLVFYGPQSVDVSQGRTPDGASAWRWFNLPTAGFDNGGDLVTTNIVTQTMPLLYNTNVWRYNQTEVPAADWIAPHYTADATWPSGAALLYVESSSRPWPKSTPLTLGRITYYFRTHFQVTNDLAGTVLNLNAMIDDGAVFYLNGQEVLRLHLPDGTVTYDTLADDHESAVEGPYALAISNLVAGDNVFAVEVHQSKADSSDVVFGLSLEATLSTTNLVTNNITLPVVFSEIMAHGQTALSGSGGALDWIELHNSGTSEVNLSGASLSDDPAVPRKWVFPENTVVPAAGYLVVACNGNLPASTNNTGFSLQAEGGAVFLFAAGDGKLVDTVAYGLQAPDLSIGRVDGLAGWQLTAPTPGAANLAALLGDSSHLKINEWMASPATGADWFELYNPEALPVEVSGFEVADDLTKSLLHPFPVLSFMGAGAYLKIVADSDPGQGPNHANFKLSASGDSIFLLNAAQDVVDQVSFLAQSKGISQGRYPNGSPDIITFTNSPTPGAANTLGTAVVDSDSDGLPDTWETAHGLNPNNPNDANLDSDGDGLTNLQEYWAGTDPQDRTSGLAVAVSITNGHPAIRFTSVPGKTYRVEFADMVAASAWQELVTLTAAAGETVLTTSDANSAGSTVRFYRVALVLAPGN